MRIIKHRRFAVSGIFAAMLVLFTGCPGHRQDEVIDRIIEPLAVTDEVSDLSPYISSLELISIDGDSSTVLNVSKLVAGKKIILLSGGVVFSVSRDGNNLKRIGEVGRGPGEYLSIKDIAVSEQTGRILCLDVNNSILEYELETGSFLGKTDIGRETGYAKALVPLENGEIGVYFSNPPSGASDAEKKKFQSFHVFDKSGKELSSSMAWTGFRLDAGFAIPVSASGGQCLVLSPEAAEPSLVFRDGKQSEKIMFEFGKKTVPDHYFAGANPWDKVGELFDSGYYKLISNVFLLQDLTYLRAFGEHSSSWNFIVPADGKRGIRWQSQGIMTPPVYAVGADNDTLYFPYNDYGLIPVKQETDPLKKAVLEKFGSDNHSNNNYLVKVSFRIE